MTDLDKLKSILDNQQERGVKDGTWLSVMNYVVNKYGAGYTLSISNVGFYFDGNGRLRGITNYKD